ncbi:O-antigen ligase family protein [Aurantibacter crassamenti]|uniref:O-antigen ligase family protein n=1 Tax=Aurantibacter crassamenti TaxID=1837375 RepID=UPI001939864C|nr:O-antigen ligase family protein [Aurantibacter crassamenti]MBM1106766.1 O-antigen ligase family protein [Aurantibacter crassamenti]
MKFLKNLNKYCLFLLIFSVTYEQWDPLGTAGIISVTYMASILYIFSWIPLLKKNFTTNAFKAYLIPLVLFLLTCFLSTAMHSEYAKSFSDLYNQRLVTLIILMLLIVNHLYNENKLVLQVLDAYLVSVTLMYILVLLGIGTTYEGGRLLLFGENPNAIGVKAVIAFLISIARMFNAKLNKAKLILGFLVLFSSLNLIILSASRGALLSVFLGLAVLVFYTKLSIVKKGLFAIIGLAFSILLFNFIIGSNTTFANRIMNSIETGDTGRNALWIGATKVIENNLIMGVGLPGALPEMYKYSGRRMDPHNTFLYILMVAGIVGLTFFGIFLFRLGKNLLLNFRINGNVVFLVIFVVILFNMAKAGGGITSIHFWFFFAILIGSTFLVNPKKTQ